MKYSLTIFLLLFSLNSHAINKWVDANGKVHYSDEPPPDNAKVVQSVRKTRSEDLPASAPAPRKTIFEQEADLKKQRKAKDEAAQKAAQEQEQAQLKKKNCDTSRSQLANLQNAPRIASYDANGQVSVMDDNARQQAISDAQAAISTYCN